MGDKVGEKDIRQLAATVKKYSPNASGIAVKTSDGPVWQGIYDTNPLMAVRGVQSIQTWVQELANFGLETHLWCVLMGRNPDAEANLVTQACRVSGVRSMRLDVNVRDWYESGLSAAVAETLIGKIRAELSANFHLALSFDPRGDNLNNIYIDTWAPYVQSLHPRIFHWEYSEGLRGPEEYLDEAFTTLAKYNLPIVPILQAYKDPATQKHVPENDIFDAGGYALTKGAPGISFFRLGEAGPVEFRGVSRIQIAEPATTATAVQPAAQPASAPQPVPTPAPTPAPAPATATPPAPVPVSQPARPVVQPTPAATSEKYVVVTELLNVRSGPGTEPRLKIQGETLSRGQIVDVQTGTRQDAGGYTWVQLANGWWVAEQVSNGSEVFLDKAPAVVTQPAAPPTAAPTTAPSDGKQYFQVVIDSPKVRSAPSASGTQTGKLGWGTIVEVDPTSRTDAEGYTWWKHDQGWSAEKSTGGDVFMLPADPNAEDKLPDTPWKLASLPVPLDVMQWFYYFGNTLYAFNNGRRWNYDGYSQGLHGGLDFGHPGGATIFAGLSGVFDGPGNAFGPNRVDVITGDYRVIYGHIASPASYSKGTAITPDMVIGKVDTTLQHLHFEIRYKDTYIVNPLLFIPKDLRDAVMKKYPPVGQFGFYSSPRWNKWVTPFDQPTITLAGPVIGPRAPQ